MVKSIIKFSAVIMLFISACSSSNSKPLLIEFSADSTAIEFHNIDPAGLLQLKNANSADSVLVELVSVLQTLSEKDTSLREEPIKGKLLLTDSSIVFKPYAPFIKGREYLVITHLNASFGSMEKMLKNEMAGSVKPNQEVLTR
ncbi:hypothetical protein [Pedobacter frigoris]|uniref:Lipoprotein n=1 Tax=Pedobacter frigoris TaxID=2571272 RepID=A0A4U1C902_9SPHI|nr:hypothetical protein [Pedobacter frigoris]TKC02902.1 hypothetical protein FA047_19745 [Pedobacter frigoris]